MQLGSGPVFLQAKDVSYATLSGKEALQRPALRHENGQLKRLLLLWLLTCYVLEAVNLDVPENRCYAQRRKWAS